MIDPGWSCLWEANAHIGESTLWDERDGCIYWADINSDNPSINWLQIATGAQRSWNPPVWVSALAVREQGGFIASTRDGLAFINPSLEIFEHFADPRSHPASTRMNDGVTDRKGRYWTGSCDTTQVEESTSTNDKGSNLNRLDDRQSGELFCVDHQQNIRTAEGGLVTANGPAFSPDGKTLYLNDTMPQVTWAYDLNDDGVLQNRRLFRKYDINEGFPDGMAVDTEGCLWIAFYEGWKLRRYSPGGEELESRRLPVRQGLRPAFGGDDYSRLFVMSGKIAMSKSDETEQPLAGALFEILEPGVKGLPNIPFAG